VKVRNWLETELTDYKTKIYEMSSKLADINVREFWRGHADAYRHIRGAALFDAILSEVVISNNTNIDDILTSAEATLAYIEKVNLGSLERLISLVDNNKRSITKEEILLLKPAYVLPILHTYVRITNEEKRTATLREIYNMYMSVLNEQERAKYAPYIAISRFAGRVKIEQLKRALGGFMKLQEKDGTIEFNCDEEVYKILKSAFK